MSQDQHTRFQLTFNGISLELHGEKEFVEEMYREVMADLEEARARNARGQMPSTAPASASQAKPPATAGAKKKVERPLEHVIWLHRCTPLVNKIYMASPSDVRKTKRLSAFVPEQIATLYVEGKLLTDVMPQFDRGQTLWAELTTAGRKKIAEASSPPAPPKPKIAGSHRKTTPGLGIAISGSSKTQNQNNE
jgi:hypothetical protein